MGRTRGKKYHGVSQIGDSDALDVMEVERALDWENAPMAWNTPCRVGRVTIMTCRNWKPKIVPTFTAPPVLRMLWRGILVDFDSTLRQVSMTPTIMIVPGP
jgi:hypothetical protein